MNGFICIALARSAATAADLTAELGRRLPHVTVRFDPQISFVRDAATVYAVRIDPRQWRGRQALASARALVLAALERAAAAGTLPAVRIEPIDPLSAPLPEIMRAEDTASRRRRSARAAAPIAARAH